MKGRPQPFDLLLSLSIIWLAARVHPASEVRGVLALIAALALLWPASSSAGKSAREDFERRRTRLLLCLALMTATFTVSRTLPEFLTTWKVRVWNVYHYYLGAKYFPELGYTDLYDATLAADQAGPNYWRRISRVRDLQTYDVEDKRSRVRAYTWQDHFEPERWQSFSRDVEALSSQLPAGDWSGIFTDRGYNGTPLWTVVGGTLATWSPAEHQLGLKLICGLDLLLLAAALGLIWKTFGLRPAVLVLLLLTLTPVNRGRFVGGLLQYDWFSAFAAGVCFYRRRRPGWAAALMAYAVMTRIFPLLFVVAGAIPALDHWRRTGRKPRRQLRFLTLFAICCGVGFVLSLANGRGLQGWSEFATGIRLHREHHLFGQARVGLQRVFTHDLKGAELTQPWTDLLSNNPSPGRARQDRVDRRWVYERQRSLYLLSAIVMISAFLLVVRRQRSWDAQLLGLVPIFALLVTSRYYASYLALLPLMGGRHGPSEASSRWLTAGQLLVFAGFYAIDSRGNDSRTAYGMFNVLLAGFFVFLLVLQFSRIRRQG